MIERLTDIGYMLFVYLVIGVIGSAAYHIAIKQPVAECYKQTIESDSTILHRIKCPEGMK